MRERHALIGQTAYVHPMTYATAVLRLVKNSKRTPRDTVHLVWCLWLTHKSILVQEATTAVPFEKFEDMAQQRQENIW